jgi:hypothetical protein
MEHAPPDCQYGHKEIAAFTDLSAVGPDPPMSWRDTSCGRTSVGIGILG